MADALGTSMKKYRKYGPLVREDLIPGFTQVHVYSPKDIQTVYNNEGPYPSRGAVTLPGLIAYRKLRGHPLGLVGLEGAEWQALRNPLQCRMQRPRTVASYVPSLEPVVDDLVTFIRQKRNGRGEIRDVVKMLNRWSMEKIGLVCFDARLGLLQPNLDRESEAMRFIQATESMFKGLHKTTHFWDIHRRFPTGVFKKFCNDSDYIHSAGKRLIQKAVEDEKHGKHSMLQGSRSLLLELMDDRELSREEAFSAIIDMLVGGIETTSFTAAFLLYQLARHPGKQEILRQEIRNHTEPGKPLDGRMIDRMSYLKACIKESLRLVPTVTGFLRVVANDVVLSGYHVPQGSICVIGVDVIGRLPEYFPEPELFIPERWLRHSEGYNAGQPFSHLPFGHGARSCIGRRFAEAEIQILITKLLSVFSLSCNQEDIGVTTSLVNHPRQSLAIKFEDKI